MSANNKINRVMVVGNYQPLQVAAETVVIAVGAAGTLKDCYLIKRPIADSNHCYIGGDGNTSLVLTSTTFTNEVAFGTLDADLANGDYWVDYVTGHIHGRKADTGTSMIADYYVFKA